MLVLGDVILDRYWWGEASRLSPEAPVPIVRKQRSTAKPGGVANTAANLVALGAAVDLIGLVGADSASDELRRVLAESGVGSDLLLRDPNCPTTAKTRIIASNHHITRVDEEETHPISDQQSAEVIALVTGRLNAADAVVISDYAKGFLTPSLLRDVIDLARRAGKPVFVDPKGPDWKRYAGTTYLKPNRLELGALAGMQVRSHEDTVIAAARLLPLLEGSKLLVTEGPEGMTLIAPGTREYHLLPSPRQVYDVTGAGDTVLAAFAIAVSAGAEPAEAMSIAIEAAAIVVGVVGTATVRADDLAAALAAKTELRPQTLVADLA